MAGVRDAFQTSPYEALAERLTEARGRVYLALVHVYAENDGWPVTVRSLQERCGLASTATVHLHLRRLLEDGFIEQGPSRYDGYRPARVAA